MQIFVLYSHLLLPSEFLSVSETTPTAGGLYATSCIIFKRKFEKKCLINDTGVYGQWTLQLTAASRNTTQ